MMLTLTLIHLFVVAQPLQCHTMPNWLIQKWETPFLYA